MEHLAVTNWLPWLPHHQKMQRMPCRHLRKYKSATKPAKSRFLHNKNLRHLMLLALQIFLPLPSSR